MIYKTREDFEREEDYVRYLHMQENEYIEKLDEKVEQGIMHPFIN